MKEKKKKTLLGEFLDLLICCFWLKLGVTYATLITITDDFESLESCLAHFRNTSMVWRHAPIYADVSRHMRPKFLVRFRCLFVHQSWESSCTTQVLLCTMTGLFPSVLVQTLWKQTRCLSVGPFFPPLLNQLCLFPLVLLKKLAEALFWGGFMFLLSPLLNLGRIRESMKQCTSNSTTIRGLFCFILNLWWGLPWGVKMLVKHVAWPSAHPPAAFTFHYLDSYRNMSFVVVFCCFSSRSPSPLCPPGTATPIPCLPSLPPSIMFTVGQWLTVAFPPLPNQWH